MTSRAEPLAAEWHEAGSGRRLQYVFARDFTTADGHRVMVAALTPRQFADLATMARLARTFAFLERLLPADFSTRGDLYTHRATLAALLAPWFARRTMADLTAAFAATSVPWTHADQVARSSAGPSAGGGVQQGGADRRGGVLQAGLSAEAHMGMPRVPVSRPRPDALEPGFQCARTQWIRGFHGVPAGPGRSSLTTRT